MSTYARAILKLVQDELALKADAKKAIEMANYMKTSMPFYGVQKPDRVPIMREIKKNHAPQTKSQYEELILRLWKQKHREEKYLSIDYAIQFIEFADTSSIPLFEKMIRDGAWWDFIDPISTQIIGQLFLDDRKSVSKIMNRWIEDKDFWVRRSAILSQLKHKDKTDRKMLFEFCRLQMYEQEFFIRKAIGWALREYSYTEPQVVKEFLLNNQDKLSNLSFREGAKRLKKAGLMPVDK